MTLRDRNEAVKRHPGYEKDYIAFILARKEKPELDYKYRRLISQKWKIEEGDVISKFEPAYWHPCDCPLPKPERLPLTPSRLRTFLDYPQNFSLCFCYL